MGKAQPLLPLSIRKATQMGIMTNYLLELQDAAEHAVQKYKGALTEEAMPALMRLASAEMTRMGWKHQDQKMQADLESAVRDKLTNQKD
jgi:hypothetical protein